MGDFDVTCAITRTAITSGDEVMVIVVPFRVDEKNGKEKRHPYLSHTHNIMNHLSFAQRQIEDRSNIRVVEDYKEFMREQIEPWLSEIKIFYGSYDSYGWLNGTPDELKYSDWDCAFIHKDVVDEIVKEYHESFMEKLPKDYDTLLAVIYFAFLARIQIFGHFLLGQQYGLYEQTELDAMKLARKLQNKKLRRYSQTILRSKLKNLRWKIRYFFIKLNKKGG
jgi:hypothetical protein